MNSGNTNATEILTFQPGEHTQMVIEQNGEVLITEAGLFAAGCMLAFADDTDEEQRTKLMSALIQHCVKPTAMDWT